MFILYHKEINQDGGSFANIACSKTKENLEKLKRTLEDVANKFENESKECLELCRQRIEDEENQVREFLKRNIDVIREFNENSPYVEPKNPEWCTKSYNPGKPYAPGVIEKDKNSIIESVAHAHKCVFYKGQTNENYKRLISNLLHLDRLTEPLLEIDTSLNRIEYPTAPIEYYPSKTLYIDEVEEIV